MTQAEPEHTSSSPNSPQHESAYDFSYVSTVARVALYDDLRSAPRVTEIMPAETAAYIDNLATTIYNQAKAAGGSISYTVIREVAENFIHARFNEVVVSILDGGCTIRFADQGPGITKKDQAQQPGLSSAIEPMKRYIRGVGSGLPIVKDYLDSSHGSITIEDNMGTGSVITISMKNVAAPAQAAQAQVLPQAVVPGSEVYRSAAALGTAQPSAFAQGTPQLQYASAFPTASQPFAPSGSTTAGTGMEAAAGVYPYGYGSGYSAQQAVPEYVPYYQPAGMNHPSADPRLMASYNNAPVQIALAGLSQKERDFLVALLTRGPLRVTDISEITGTPASSTHNVLKKLEEAGLVETIAQKKRTLTPLGRQAAQQI